MNFLEILLFNPCRGMTKSYPGVDFTSLFWFGNDLVERFESVRFAILNVNIFI